MLSGLTYFDLIGQNQLVVAVPVIAKSLYWWCLVNSRLCASLCVLVYVRVCVCEFTGPVVEWWIRSTFLWDQERIGAGEELWWVYNNRSDCVKSVEYRAYLKADVVLNNFVITFNL